MVSHRSTLKRKTQVTQLSCVDYSDLRARLKQHGPTPTDKPKTQASLKAEWQKWESYCIYLKLGDAKEALQNSDAGDFIAYLEWRNRESPFQGQRRTTVEHWWKRLCINYKRKLNLTVPPQTRNEVNESLKCGGYLVTKFDLNVNPKEKEPMDIDEFYHVISVLWQASMDRLHMRDEEQRSDFWLFEHLNAYTGTRPGALVDNLGSLLTSGATGDRAEFATVFNLDDLFRYKHCTLTLYPAEDGVSFGDLVLGVELRHTKGGLSEGRQPPIYPLFASPCLALCPITSFLRRAFADKAFLVEELSSPAKLFQLTVPRNKQCLEIAFKPSVMETPIFRDRNGAPLKYPVMRKLVHGLGLAAGYKDNLISYCLRRGFADAIHGKVSTSVQNQAMNHRHIRIFEQHYQNRHLGVDVQNLFIGLPCKERLIKLCSSMGRSRDLDRPVKLTKGDLDQAYLSEEVQALQSARIDAKIRCKELYRTIEKSRGSNEHEIYTKASTDEKAAKARTKAAALKDTRERYDNARLVSDVRNQLLGIAEEPIPQETPSVAVHPLRERVASALFSAELPAYGSVEDIFRRTSVLDDLLRLCDSETSSEGDQNIASRERNHCDPCANPHCAAVWSSAGWRNSDIGRLCHACFMYHERNQRLRPASLAQAVSRNERFSSAHDECSGCGAKKGEIRSSEGHIGKLCEICQGFYGRFDSHGPQPVLRHGDAQSYKAPSQTWLLQTWSLPSLTCISECSGNGLSCPVDWTICDIDPLGPGNSTQCVNCARVKVSVRTIRDGKPLCKPCYDYRHSHGIDRPRRLFDRVRANAAENDPSLKQCSSCKAVRLDVCNWELAGVGRACVSCYQYYRRNGRHRSTQDVTLIQQPQPCCNCRTVRVDNFNSTKFGMICKPCYAFHGRNGTHRTRARGSPNQCSRCETVGLKIWNYTGIGTVCKVCYNYYKKHGYHRPQHLISRRKAVRQSREIEGTVTHQKHLLGYSNLRHLLPNASTSPEPNDSIIPAGSDRTAARGEVDHCSFSSTPIGPQMDWLDPQVWEGLWSISNGLDLAYLECAEPIESDDADAIADSLITMLDDEEAPASRGGMDNGHICPNPDCKTTEAARWRPTDLGWLCEACAQYYDAYGCYRPRELAHKMSTLAPRPEGQCLNCELIDPRAYVLKGMGIFCQTCAQYYRRRGFHRPQRLVRRTQMRKPKSGTKSEFVTPADDQISHSNKCLSVTSQSNTTSQINHDSNDINSSLFDLAFLEPKLSESNLNTANADGCKISESDEMMDGYLSNGFATAEKTSSTYFGRDEDSGELLQQFCSGWGSWQSLTSSKLFDDGLLYGFAPICGPSVP